MVPSLTTLGGIFLGWSLGANDAANVFGTAVSSRMVRFRPAVIILAIFVLAGALLGGSPGIHTLGRLTGQTLNTAFYISLGAALTVTMGAVRKSVRKSAGRKRKNGLRNVGKSLELNHN